MVDATETCGNPDVHVWGRESLVACAKYVLDCEARGVLRDAKITSDNLTYGKPKHVEVRTTEESASAVKPFNDIWTCPPWPPSVCEGG